MDATLYIPTGLTFSDIREGTPEAAITALNAYLSGIGAPEVNVGDNNPLVLRLNDFDMGGAAFYRGNAMDDLASCGPISNISHIHLPYVQLIVGVGGDITGLTVLFAVPDKTVEVPESFPNRTHTVYSDPEDPESGVETVHTWETWGRRNDNEAEFWVEKEGVQYRTSQDGGNSGDPIPASAWAFAGLTVINHS